MTRWSQWFAFKGSILTFAIGLALPIGVTDGVFGQRNREREASSRTLMGGRYQGGPNHLMRMARRLNLSETQKEQVKFIAEQFEAETEALHEQIRNGRRDVHQSLMDGTFNEAEAGEKLAEVGRLEARLMGFRHHIMQEMKLILTPEQLEQLEQAKERMQNRRLRRSAPSQ